MTTPLAPSPPSRRLVAALAVAIGALTCLFALQKIYDPDTWWHLATGRWVIEHRLVPAHDIFSFATANAPWVAYSWLPATGMYLVHAAGGPSALILVKAALLSGAFVLGFLLAVRARLHPWLVAVALTLAIPIARFQFRERPQIVMFGLVALYFWLLAEPRAERRLRTWLLLGIAQIAWANSHGSFFLGIALTGALFFEHVLASAVALVRRRPVDDLRGLALSAGLLLLVVAASLATPYGLALPLQTLRDMGALTVTHTFVNEEFQPLAPSDYPFFVAFAALTALSFAGSTRRTRPFTAAVFLGFAVLAFGSVRFAAIAALVFAFVLPLNLQPLVDRLSTRLLQLGRPPPARATAAVLAALLAAFAAITFHLTFGPGREFRFGLGVNESRFPGPAVQFLAKSGFEGNLFNSWAYGGYVLWKLPKAKDLVDGRALPAHLALLDELGTLERPALQRWLAAQDVRGALLARHDDWIGLFAESPRYTRVFFDDRAVVYLRKDVAAAGGAAGPTYRFIQPESYDPSYLAPIARGPQAADAEAEIRRAIAETPSSFTPRFLLGVFLEAQGKPEALDHYLAAAKLNPGLAFAHNDLGRRAGALAIATGQAARVEPLLRDAMAISPDDPLLHAFLGASLYAQKRLPEAEAMLRKALAKEPDLPVALLNLGYLCVDSSRFAEAIPLFRRARAAAPGSESAAYGLALSLHGAGDRAAAATAWREFLSAFPSSKWAPRARQRLAELGGR
jgi:tetratricopeptide (TPR) repeat protein